MKLHQLLTEKNIVIYDKQHDKHKIIEDLLNHLWHHSNLKNEGFSRDELFKEFLVREKEQTTAIGAGFAFPHIRLNNCHGSYFLLAVSKNGVEFDSLDKQPVNFLIVTVVPRLKPAVLLTFRAAISSILLKQENRSAILCAAKREEIFSIFQKADISLEQQILARDIMKPVSCSLSPDMTLYDAARELHRYHVDSMPVIDQDGTVLGKLSCHDLFSYKLPEFFNTLHTISFIRNMNPFEKYFESDQTETLSSLSFKEMVPSLSPEATLMEIVFQMTVNNKELLYVVEDEKLLGTIDRYSIIDKILISNIDGEQL